ncbi:2OG-Fe(II) oxygenase [Fluviicola sp.]|uniref:2OG-Fe(II) oxygenase n=1 Tax=Fluviicola sp. TaxID=1917219 RepID=UPI003D2B2BEE
MVLYLNEDWKKEDGGLLSLYPKAGQQIDISPLGGRMVLFRSDEMEHEVNPSLTRTRNSIAGWLKN